MSRFNLPQTEAIMNLVDATEATGYAWTYQQRYHEELGHDDELACWKSAQTDLAFCFDLALMQGVPWDTCSLILFRNLPYDLAKKYSVHPTFKEAA